MGGERAPAERCSRGDAGRVPLSRCRRMHPDRGQATGRTCAASEASRSTQYCRTWASLWRSPLSPCGREAERGRGRRQARHRPCGRDWARRANRSRRERPTRVPPPHLQHGRQAQQQEGGGGPAGAGVPRPAGHGLCRAAARGSRDRFLPWRRAPRGSLADSATVGRGGVEGRVEGGRAGGRAARRSAAQHSAAARCNAMHPPLARPLGTLVSLPHPPTCQSTVTRSSLRTWRRPCSSRPGGRPRSPWAAGPHMPDSGAAAAAAMAAGVRGEEGPCPVSQASRHHPPRPMSRCEGGPNADP